MTNHCARIKIWKLFLYLFRFFLPLAVVRCVRYLAWLGREWLNLALRSPVGLAVANKKQIKTIVTFIPPVVKKKTRSFEYKLPANEQWKIWSFLLLITNVLFVSSPCIGQKNPCQPIFEATTLVTSKSWLFFFGQTCNTSLLCKRCFPIDDPVFLYDESFLNVTFILMSRASILSRALRERIDNWERKYCRIEP